MTTDPIFGAATHANPNSILCITRDGAEHRLPGPANMDGGERHRVRMSFVCDYFKSQFDVTFRRARQLPYMEYSGERYVEESAAAVER